MYNCRLSNEFKRQSNYFVEMVRNKILFSFILFLSLTQVGQAQDPHFSQFYANRLYLNPAFAGADICPKFTSSYRNQWPALGKTFVTYTASVDGYVHALQGGLGLNVMSDRQGDGALSTTAVDGMYAYTVRVTNTFNITGGFQASYVNRKLDWQGLIFPDMINELYGVIYNTAENPPENLTASYFDFSAGLLGFGKNYYFGLAVHHLAQPEESYFNSSDAVLPRKYTLHAGAKIPLKHRRYKRGELSISPNLMYQRQQDFEQLNYGLYISRHAVTFGMWMRQNFDFHYDSFILLIGFVQEQLKISYSYDLTISKLAKETLGGHEVSFGYQFPCRTRKIKRNAISCPRW